MGIPSRLEELRTKYPVELELDPQPCVCGCGCGARILSYPFIVRGEWNERGMFQPRQGFSINWEDYPHDET